MPLQPCHAGQYRFRARGRGCVRRGVVLKPEVAERGVIIRAAAERPVIFALTVLDREIIDAGDPPPHQALGVELPILVAITAEPAAGIVVPFIGESYGDP